MARGLHETRHADSATPLEIVACDGLPEAALLESLFGLEGRTPGRPGGLYWPGAFERSRGGTLVLARIDAAPPAVVVRLRSALGEGRLLPAGGDERTVPACGIVATARDPRASAVRALGEFFEQQVALPPLRERRGDIEDLFWHFAREAGFGGFPEAAAAHFASLEWPGNVGELRRAVGEEIERCLGKHASPGMKREDVEAAVRSSWSPPEIKTPPAAKKKKKRTKKDKILELAARVASGELTADDAARLSGATVSYTKRVLRKGR